MTFAEHEKDPEFRQRTAALEPKLRANWWSTTDGNVKNATATGLYPIGAAVRAAGSSDLTFLMNECGRPYKGDAFSAKFGLWRAAAGLPQGCVFHGLRKAACRIMAEKHGFTVHQIAAWSGHRNLNEIARYTKAADQRKIAQGSLARMVRKAAAEQNSTESVKLNEPRVSNPLTKLKKKA